jgi:acyl-coenzyme A thioesterase PaaI-like protein
VPESWSSRFDRWRLNWFPAYRGTGARITYIADDWLEVRVRLPLTWRTRNYVGTIFGGSLYGAVDPIYMVMLIRALGPEYVVWDQAATIRFLRPGRSTLHATFRLEPEAVAGIAADARIQGRTTRDFRIELTDGEGRVCFQCTKTIHVRWSLAPMEPGAARGR